MTITRRGAARGLSAGDLDHAESLELLRRQTEVCELLASGSPLGEVLEAVTGALEELIPGSRCSVLLLDAEQGTLHHGAAPRLPRVYCEAIDGIVIGPEAGSCGGAAFFRVPVIASDIEVDHRWAAFRHLALPHGLRACWSTPIVGGQGTVLGTFAVYHGEPHAPTPRESRLVGHFTHLAAVAIDHARLQDERQARHEAEVARTAAEVARTAAEAASRAKSEFLSAMSHEVRTPLSAVVGFAEILETLDLTPERRQAALRHIGEAGNHIIALLDDVLDMAKIEARVVQLEREPICLGPIVREVVELVEPLAAERQITVAAEPIDHGGVVTADCRRLRQVLLNLVTNAIKYNRPGGRVDVKVSRQGGYETIAVVDTGPGISRSRQRRLFVPFDRLGAEASGLPGCGLGLPLARGLVEAMGGSLTVRSRPGHGTSVHVVLEAAGAPAGPVAEPSAGLLPSLSPDPAAVRSDVGGLVLYVEDDPTNVDLLVDLLQVRPEVELVVDTGGSAALRTVRQRRPDVVLLDLDLPDMPGEQVLAGLATDPELATIPVAVISGRVPTTALQIPVFRKPLDVWALLDYLDRTLPSPPGQSARTRAASSRGENGFGR